MTYYTIRNSFHGTSTRVRADGLIHRHGEVTVYLTKRQCQRLRSVLCGDRNCNCGGWRGPQQTDEGQRLIVEMDTQLYYLADVADENYVVIGPGGISFVPNTVDTGERLLIVGKCNAMGVAAWLHNEHGIVTMARPESYLYACTECGRVFSTKPALVTKHGEKFCFDCE